MPDNIQNIANITAKPATSSNLQEEGSANLPKNIHLSFSIRNHIIHL